MSTSTMRAATSNATSNPPGTTQLSCGCVVASQTGSIPACPKGCTQDTPDRLRRWA